MFGDKIVVDTMEAICFIGGVATQETTDMNNAVTQIVETLNGLLAGLDEAHTAKSVKWALARKEALREFQQSDEYTTLCRSYLSNFYERIYGICGGKTWYHLFSGRNDAMISEAVAKICAVTYKKRNATISAKLVKAGVTEALNSSYAYTDDGFHGTFQVQTNAGSKMVEIDTIYAGGYNIQCLHTRTLVKVR